MAAAFVHVLEMAADEEERKNSTSSDRRLKIKTSVMMTTQQQIFKSRRIDSMDILRGIAIFGMIISHAVMYGNSDTSGTDKLIAEANTLFIGGRFSTIFAMLFGASFAIQLGNAKVEGKRFVPHYLRRLFGLFCFGVIAAALGFSVLIELALCGVLLLLVRNWSTKALIITFFVCLLSIMIYLIVQRAYYEANNKVEELKSSYRVMQDANRKRNEKETTATGFRSFVNARAEIVLANYSNPAHALLNLTSVYGYFIYVLLGFLALRVGIFEHPEKHHWLIIGLMIFGIISWLVYNWVLPFFKLTPSQQYPNVPYALETFYLYLSRGFMIIQQVWSSFFYMGLILLLVAKNAVWLKRLQFFGCAGRMALTNYMLQAAVFSLLFTKYAIGLPGISLRYAPVLALLLFSILVLFSRWWLKRYNFGPAEWLLRSFTYWQWQPMKKKETTRLAETIL